MANVLYKNSVKTVPHSWKSVAKSRPYYPAVYYTVISSKNRAFLQQKMAVEYFSTVVSPYSSGL